MVIAEVHGIRPAELIEEQKKDARYSEPSAYMYRMK